MYTCLGKQRSSHSHALQPHILGQTHKHVPVNLVQNGGVLSNITVVPQPAREIYTKSYSVWWTYSLFTHQTQTHICCVWQNVHLIRILNHTNSSRVQDLSCTPFNNTHTHIYLYLYIYMHIMDHSAMQVRMRTYIV